LTGIRHRNDFLIGPLLHLACLAAEGTEPPPAPAPNTQLAQQLRDLTTERYSETLLNVLDLLLVLIERTVSTHAYLTDAMANYAAARVELLAAPRLVPLVAAPNGAGPVDAGSWAGTTDADGGGAVAAPVPGLLAEEQRELLAVDVSLVEWARSAALLDPQLQLDSEDIVQAVCDMAHMRVARLLAIRKEVRLVLVARDMADHRGVLMLRTGCVVLCYPILRSLWLRWRLKTFSRFTTSRLSSSPSWSSTTRATLRRCAARWRRSARAFFTRSTQTRLL